MMILIFLLSIACCLHAAVVQCEDSLMYVSTGLLCLLKWTSNGYLKVQQANPRDFCPCTLHLFMICPIGGYRDFVT